MIEIDLIRHVKVSGKPALYGCTDVAPIATENDRLLQRLIAQQQTTKAYHSVISSSLSRCQQVAQNFSQRCQLPLTLSKPLQEMNFGKFDGVAFDDLFLANPLRDKKQTLNMTADERKNHGQRSDLSANLSWSELDAFFHSPAEVVLPEAESLTDFHYRITQAWKNLITQQVDINAKQKDSKTPRRILVIAHGGVIRMILAHVLQLDWKNAAWYQQLHIGYGSLSRIIIHQPYLKTTLEQTSEQALSKQTHNQLHQQVTAIAMPFIDGF